MDNIIEKFLKAKHWQLFLILIGTPIIFQIIMTSSIAANVTVNSEPDPTIVFDAMKFFPFLMIIVMGTFFGWFWSIAIGLQHKVPQHIKMKTSSFKFFFFTPLIYILLINIGIFSIFNTALEGDASPNFGMMAGFVALIIPLHLFSIFCMFYILYFVAKTIKTIELQREAHFSDYVGEFFLIWFYPIGIWFIQARINQIYEGSNNKPNTVELQEVDV